MRWMHCLAPCPPCPPQRSELTPAAAAAAMAAAARSWGEALCWGRCRLSSSRCRTGCRIAARSPTTPIRRSFKTLSCSLATGSSRRRRRQRTRSSPCPRCRIPPFQRQRAQTGGRPQAVQGVQGVQGSSPRRERPQWATRSGRLPRQWRTQQPQQRWPHPLRCARQRRRRWSPSAALRAEDPAPLQ